MQRAFDSHRSQLTTTFISIPPRWPAAASLHARRYADRSAPFGVRRPNRGAWMCSLADSTSQHIQTGVRTGLDVPAYGYGKPAHPPAAASERAALRFRAYAN